MSGRGLGMPRAGALPYHVLAGVEPCPGGWLVAPGNLQGITLAPQTAFVAASLADILDYRPAFTVVALHAPVGVADQSEERRRCDVSAREALGRRAGAALPGPTRPMLEARSLAEAQALDPTFDVVRWQTLPKSVEAIREVQSWRQRVVWEVNPELAFKQMNDGAPLAYSRRSIHGLRERRELLELKLPAADRVLQGRHRSIREGKLLDALADLWTARRIMARAITRLADPPAWNSDGVRMDIVC